MPVVVNEQSGLASLTDATSKAGELVFASYGATALACPHAAIIMPQRANPPSVLPAVCSACITVPVIVPTILSIPLPPSNPSSAIVRTETHFAIGDLGIKWFNISVPTP